MKNTRKPLVTRLCRRAVRVAACAVFASFLAAGADASTYVWNNTTNTWETPSAFDINGVPATTLPTATDIASFDPTIPNASGAIINPTINSASDVAAALNLDNNYLGGTYTFTGSGTLTLGSGGIVTRGFGTQTINGPTLAGAATGNLSFGIGTDSGLTLSGATVATANAGAVNLNGGTLTLDNSTNSTLHLSTLSVPSFVGGTLSVVGNSAGTAYTLGAVSFNAGFNTVSVNAANGATSVNFANSGAFSLRTQTFMAEQYVTTSGALGTVAGGLVTFTGTPNTSTTIVGGNGGAISNNTTTTVGFATVSDTNGTNFATYITPNGGTGGITAITPSATVSDAGGLAGLTANSVAQFNPAANATVTATGSVASGTLRITPAGPNSVLALGANNLTGVALMLDGANNFTISGTGTFGASGTRYIYVNNASTTLTTSINIASSSNPTDIVGPGFVALNGSGSQNTLTTTNRLTLLGGVLRGNNTELGFGTTGGAGFINFRGGVLEIANGSNGTGASADYTRPLATTATAGDTNWTTSSTDEGSGGFSAFGNNASVNLGGATAKVTWSTGGFVADGYALKFGSTQSNATLTFQNPIALDSGTAGTYAAREISVTQGTGTAADRTVLSGTISGSSSTDLLKTGTGTLQLTTGNTYAGRTIIEGGFISASGESAFGANPAALVTNQITLNGGGVQASTGNINFSSNRGITLGASGGTFDTNTFNITDSATNPITGPGALTKINAGTLSLAAANTYTGATTINGGTLSATDSTGTSLGGTSGVAINTGGTLLMGAANQFNATTPAPVSFNGASGAGNTATFSVNGNSQGGTSSVPATGIGALTLVKNSTNNIIDFNSLAADITFASFTPNGATLTINNYLTNSGAPGGPDGLIFDQYENSNLGNIVFTGFGATTESEIGTTGFYEVYPGAGAAVPEPGTVWCGLLMVGAAGWSQRRWIRGWRVLAG